MFTFIKRKALSILVKGNLGLSKEAPYKLSFLDILLNTKFGSSTLIQTQFIEWKPNALSHCPHEYLTKSYNRVSTSFEYLSKSLRAKRSGKVCH